MQQQQDGTLPVKAAVEMVTRPGFRVPKGAQEMLERLIRLAGYGGRFRAHVGPRIRGSSHKKGLQISPHAEQHSVPIIVQPGGNDTRHQYSVTTPACTTTNKFHAALEGAVERFENDAARRDTSPTLNPVLNGPTTDTQQSNTETRSADTPPAHVSKTNTRAPEHAPGSLRGMATDTDIIRMYMTSLVRMFPKNIIKIGKGAKAVLEDPDSGFQGYTAKALGNIQKQCVFAGYLERVAYAGGNSATAKEFLITPKGCSLVSQSDPTAIQRSLADTDGLVSSKESSTPMDLFGKMQPFLQAQEELSRIDAERRSLIAGYETKDTSLAQQLEQLQSQRSELQTTYKEKRAELEKQQAEIQQRLADPKLKKIMEGWQAFETLMKSVENL